MFGWDLWGDKELCIEYKTEIVLIIDLKALEVDEKALITIDITYNKINSIDADLGATEIGPDQNIAILIREKETKTKIQPTIIEVKDDIQVINNSNIQVETIPLG